MPAAHLRGYENQSRKVGGHDRYESGTDDS
jgi:hypothetical protein